MNKFIYVFSFLLLTITTSIAQQDRYALKIGLHTGLSNYYGDLSHQIWDLPQQLKQPIKDLNFLSYGLSVEYHISRTFGLRLWGMKSQFKASDRTYEKSATYNRALNVQTDLFDASLLGIVYFDNDLVLNSRAPIAPYFMFGGGLTHFKTKGDLLSADNNRYHYWSDNTIRTEAETGSNAATAATIEQDYTYETALQTLKTEGLPYDPITWNVALGLGLKFRLSNRFHLHLEALVRYTGSDYLDDVSGDYPSSYDDNFQAYASNPSGANRSTRGESQEMNDWYTFVGLSAHYSFGQKTYKIRPSIIYTDNLLSSSLIKNTNTGSPSNSNNNKASSQEPSNTTGSDTTIQKVTTTTTTIKTVTVDTVDNRSSSVDPKTNNTELVVVKKEVLEPANTDTLGVDSISNSLVLNELLQHSVDSLLEDSIRVLTTIVYTPAPVNQNVIQKETTTTNSSNVNQIRALEVVQQEQKHQYELLLQKERYERQLAEFKLQKDLERERTRSTPNTKERELEYQLKLEQQKLANELEKQKLLNQLAAEKNRPAPDNTQDALKLQEQKYEADLKLQKQAYEHQIEVQRLRNQLNLEQLKKAKEGTGTLTTPAPSNNATAQELERLSNAIEEQNNRPITSGSDTVIIINNNTATPTNSNAATERELLRIQAEQKALLLKIKNLEAANLNAKKDTIQIIQTDSIFVGNKDNAALTKQLNQQQNSNNSLTRRLALANQKSSAQQNKMDSLQNALTKESLADIPTNSSPVTAGKLLQMEAEQKALLLKIKNLEATNLNAKKDTIQIIQTDSIFVGNKDNSALTRQLNQQQTSNNSLTQKLARANQKSSTQQSKIDSLQNALTKAELAKNTVTNKLDAFLTEKKGTYVTKIYFDMGKSSLTVQAKETLTTLVYYLEKYPTVKFWVKGFASKTGRTDVNERLSAERASEVADFLKQSKIQGERIKTTPLGEQDSNSSNELDRRAEVHLSF